VGKSVGSKVIKLLGQEIRIRGKLLKVARLDGDKYTFLEDPAPMVDALRSCGTRIDLFTFLQRLPETTPKFSYPMEWDNLAVIKVSTFEDWWNNQLRFKARNKARQAEKKGVTLREVPFDEALVRGIWEIYNECPVRQGRPFQHYGKDFATVYRESATYLDKSIFIGAFLDGKLIGFTKLVTDETRTQANLMNIVSMIQSRDRAPTNALIARAVRTCAEQGIPHLVYSNFAYRQKVRDSLSDFKESNGFQRIDLPRYYVPLTKFGQMAFRLNLHRSISDRIPRPIADKLRGLRTAWYNRKVYSPAEAS
jgi:hypothetical protein